MWLQLGYNVERRELNMKRVIGMMSSMIFIPRAIFVSLVAINVVSHVRQ